MEISKHDWTESSSRPCAFCLCLQGGSVYADFDVNSTGRVHLVRISFDRYGCCETAGKVWPMPPGASRTLVERVAAGDVNCDEVREILFRYFDKNQTIIWREALVAYDLLKE